ncbi:unnamed protein product [Nezara viridula]|uniref:Transmembrane protein n=1 Tax=Nezara viridula TaxID=85310 RepID=A0A9P0H1X5_NEZVI|nr:unnamed protein product [Nezara viridula]
MDNLNYKFENYLLKLARSKRMSYEMMHKKKEALFWAMVNMLCIIIVPVLLSFTSFGIPVVKMITNLGLLSNLFMHTYVILRNPKSLEQEMSEDKFSSQQPGQKEKILVKLLRPPKTVQTSSFELPSLQDSPSPVAPQQITYDVETEIISRYFKMEAGVLITPKGVVIKHCRCPVLNYKCRLCPFRTYPLAYFKSWFWGTAGLANEECPYCGVGFIMFKDEYETLLKGSYPLHHCICHCYYCKYAKHRPLRPRVNLIPDINHCSCICRQCRGIEDIVHGIQPLEDGKQFRIFQIPLSNSHEEKSSHSLLSRVTTSFNSRQFPLKSQILRNIISIGDCKNLQIHSEVWRRFGINPFNLVTWIANLRAWVSNTILKRLVEEMALIDHKLQWHGLSLITIGEVGLDILRATAYSEQISREIPSLAQMLPFLEICANQQYVVQRIRELAVGNNMREFSGQSTGNCRDPMWSGYVPSDSELVMHLVMTYLDAMLPPMDLEPRKRTFSTVFFSKSPKMPPQNEIAIIQQNARPTSYQVLVKGKICPIPTGHNNIFFTLLLFIHCIKKFHQSTLGKTNIGPAGLNMLWIIDDV